MAMSWPSPVDLVSVTVNGIAHDGTYYVQQSMIYVQSSFGSKAARVGDSEPKAIARLLLSDLVRASFSTD